MRATPARVQRAGGLVVLSCALKYHVGPRCSVIYVGQWYIPPTFAFSFVTALTLITGMGQNISLGLLFSICAPLTSHDAPCSDSPMMYAPSRDGPSTSSTVIILVTRVKVTNLSSSHWFFWAVTWQIAVRKLVGLTSPLSHVTLGISLGLFIHSSSWKIRSEKFFTQDPSAFILGQARFAHDVGTRSKYNAIIKSSIASLIVSSPANPSCNSLIERLISTSNTFMMSISWMNTFWYGPISSRLLIKSSTSKLFSPNLSRSSLAVASATCCGDAAPSPLEDPFGCSSISVLNMVLLC
mmetsp:Transcript_23452/g.49082  ORF Transcript_23452/g.49082 Transcript_23452/m.49082 type:complete len:296 (+) Transcript_23452:124-1011(+)